MINYICFIAIAILALIAACFYRSSRYWRKERDAYMNYYTQAKEEWSKASDALREKGIEIAELQRENKKLRRNG